MKEAELYEPIKTFFEKQEYEIYAEVMLPGSRKRADLIAKLEDSEEDVMAVELKTSVSKDLVDQAIAHRHFFPYVYIGIPERRNKIPAAHMERLAFHGIGILEVTTLGSLKQVKVRQHALFMEPKRKLRKPWSELLLPEHQQWLPGGSAGGGYVTEYSLTMERIKNYLYKSKQVDDSMKNQDGHGKTNVNRKGWRTASDIVENCPTHWGNPKGSAVQSLLEFEGRWVDAKKLYGKWHFRCKENFVPRGTIEGD